MWRVEDGLEGGWWIVQGGMGGWRVEAGGWRLEVGGWRLEVGGWRVKCGWRLEVGGLRLEVGGWKMESGGLRLQAQNHRVHWHTPFGTFWGLLDQRSNKVTKPSLKYHSCLLALLSKE